MSIITLLTDFGSSDHFVASLKGTIRSLNREVEIIDISHNIEPGNFIQSAYQLKSVYREFPVGTVHLFSINSVYSTEPKYIAVEKEGYYFIGPDNGFLGLVIEGQNTTTYDINPDNLITTFPSRDIFTRSAVNIIEGQVPEVERTEFNRMLGRSLRATKEQIIGNVIYVDSRGNLITNIEKDVFDKLRIDKAYTIKFGREYVSKLNILYNEVQPGDCFVLFNSNGNMEIGINEGNASQLLGLDYDSTILITFEK